MRSSQFKFGDFIFGFFTEWCHYFRSLKSQRSWGGGNGKGNSDLES